MVQPVILREKMESDEGEGEGGTQLRDLLGKT